MNRQRNVFIVAIGLIITQLSFAADWPNWRGPNYNGISEETGWSTDWPKDGPKVLWKNSVGIGFSCITVSNGKAYTIGNADNNDTIYCFDAETGKTIWKFGYKQQLDPKYYEGGSLASVTIDATKAYTVSKDGKAFCLNAKDGKPIWSKNLLEELKSERSTWGVSGSPVVIDELVIYNIGSKGLALNKADGTVKWQSGTTPHAYATPVPFNNKKDVAIFGEQNLFGLETATGQQIWSYPWKTSYNVNAADPIFIDDNTIFVSSGYDVGCALLKVSDHNVAQLWKNKNIRNKMNVSVVWKKNIFGVDEGGKLVCLDLATGNVAWSQEGFGMGSLMIADGKLIVMSEKGNLVIAEASPEKYTPIAQASVLTGKCWTVPVLANGRIYVRNAKGDVVCLDVGKPGDSKPAAQNTDWPQWQGPNRDNKSTETGLLKSWPEGGPKMLWSFEGLGEGYSTVSIANDMIYTTGLADSNGSLFAFDMQGNLKWKKLYGPEWIKDHAGTRGTPAINDGCVYVISGFGKVICFDAVTGEQKWSADVFKDYNGGDYTSWGIAESPIIIGDKVFCTPGGKTTEMVALDKKIGQKIWTTKSIGENAAYCTPQVIQKQDTTMLVTMLAQNIIAVDSANGAIIWQYDCNHYEAKPKEINPNTPLYAEGCIFVTSGYGKGSGKIRLADDGKSVAAVEWKNADLDCHHGGVVLVNGYIYGSNQAGDWICLDWKDGSVKWKTKSPAGKGSVAYADEMLYCYGETGTAALVKPSPEGFNMVSSFKVPKGKGMMWAHPVICGGTMYIRYGDALMAYDIKM